MIIVKLIPFVLVAVIAGLIVARLVRGRVSVALPKIALPKKKRHLRAIDKDAMDRELSELLKRK
ncbi:MAG: hypothetical protein WCE44_16825 [Candidatus Velthaea sp.]|jgi:hypothetical protein